MGRRRVQAQVQLQRDLLGPAPKEHREDLFLSRVGRVARRSGGSCRNARARACCASLRGEPRQRFFPPAERLAVPSGGSQRDDPPSSRIETGRSHRQSGSLHRCRRIRTERAGGSPGLSHVTTRSADTAPGSRRRAHRLVDLRCVPVVHVVEVGPSTCDPAPRRRGRGASHKPFRTSLNKPCRRPGVQRRRRPATAAGHRSAALTRTSAKSRYRSRTWAKVGCIDLAMPGGILYRPRLKANP